MEEKLIKPSQAKQADRASNPTTTNKFAKPTVKVVDKNNKVEEKSNKLPEKPTLKSARTNDEKPKEKTVTIIDKAKPAERTSKVTTNDTNSADKADKKYSSKENNFNDITIKPIEKISKKPGDKKEKSPEKTVNKAGPEKGSAKNSEKSKIGENKVSEKGNNKLEENSKTNKTSDKTKVEETLEDRNKMATKPPTPLEKSPSKVNVNINNNINSFIMIIKLIFFTFRFQLPPRKPSLQKQLSKEDGPVKKWRDPLHERVKENIDKTLANEVPKGHTLTKNESLRSKYKYLIKTRRHFMTLFIF